MAEKNARQRKEKVVINEEYKCFHCEQVFKDKEFYKSYSDAHKYIPICKDCFKNLFEQYTEKYNSPTRALWRLCSMFDIYYYQNLVDSILDKARENNWENVKIVQDYMRQINSQPQWKFLTFYDSESVKTTSIEEIPNDTTNEQDIKTWGNGYDILEFRRLNELYKEWSNGTPQDTITQVSLTQDLCKICFMIEKELSKGNSASGLLKTKNDIIKQLAIDPATLQKYKQTAESTQCFGNWVKDIEEYMPAEKYYDRNLYKDFLGIEKYFNKHFIRPIKNLLLGHRDYPNVMPDTNDDYNLNYNNEDIQQVENNHDME